MTNTISNTATTLVGKMLNYGGHIYKINTITKDFYSIQKDYDPDWKYFSEVITIPENYGYQPDIDYLLGCTDVNGNSCILFADMDYILNNII